MITPYEEITCVYRKAHMIVMQVIFRLKITKLSYVGMICFDFDYMLS
jgi:hypothetical protein